MQQLALFPDPPAPPAPTEIDIIDALLEAHGGDARAVIHELLLDADFLRGELYTASRMMSAGLERGWRPRYERL